MANLRDIKRRITSVQSTQKITRAMKMVAASKLRRAQESIIRARPYAYHMRDLVTNLATRAESRSHPLLRPGGGGKVGLVVVTSDRGLCGGFNANIVNRTLQTLQKDFGGREVEVTIVGRKGRDALRRRQCNIRQAFVGHADERLMRTAVRIIEDIVEDYMQGGTDEVYCLYNEFKSAVQQTVTLERMLPFVPEAPDPGAKPVDFLYEPSQEEVFDGLLMRNIHVQMHRILCESAASEYGARMTAMDSATRNAGEVIERLRLQYNRARQDAITKELIEVISGAEAL